MTLTKKLHKKIEVRISRAGMSAETVSLKEGLTVADVLDEVGMNKKDTESIRINQKDAKLDTVVKDGDRIVLTKNIQGGV